MVDMKAYLRAKSLAQLLHDGVEQIDFSACACGFTLQAVELLEGAQKNLFLIRFADLEVRYWRTLKSFFVVLSSNLVVISSHADGHRYYATFFRVFENDLRLL